MDPNKDYYAILGVHPTAEIAVIEAAYKALAKRYHPDMNQDNPDEAKRRMQDINEAFEQAIRTLGTIACSMLKDNNG